MSEKRSVKIMGLPQVLFMTIKEQLIDEIQQLPDPFLKSLLDLLLFLKNKLNRNQLSTNVERFYFDFNDNKIEIESSKLSPSGLRIDSEYLQDSISSSQDSIWDLGTEPVECDVADGAINHDHYLYN